MKKRLLVVWYDMKHTDSAVIMSDALHKAVKQHHQEVL